MTYNNYKVYQKALERLVECVHLTHRERRDDASLLYELVNNLKGCKPENTFDYDAAIYCGNCGHQIFRNFKCCPICEKRIDWSDWEVIEDGE